MDEDSWICVLWYIYKENVSSIEGRVEMEKNKGNFQKNNKIEDCTHIHT